MQDVRIIKQNSFTINIFLDEDKIDKETVMYHIYHAIQKELNSGNVDYMNLIVTPSKSYGDLLSENNIVQKIFLIWTFVQVFPKQIKSNKKYFFPMVFSRRANSIGFYNKIILKRKDLTVNSRINDCAISVD